MSIQTILNQQVLNYFPKIQRILKSLKSADKFEANQIRCRVWRECSNSRTAIADMKEYELKKFENELIAIFKNNNWI